MQIDYVPNHLRKYLKFNEKFSFPTRKLSSRDVNKLASVVEVLNYEREVFNTNRYGLVRHETNMLVVQVGRDAERLQYLIISLAQVHYIQSVLVVFSHSYYDDKINKLISSIKFCRVMQIFYPYSLQLYPNKFPGIDAEDCLSGAGKIDKYCSNRDARLTEHKHHWWWKACFVFNNLDWSDNYKGTVVFLEEDNYVLPDLLYMLRYTTRTQAYIQGLYVISLGRPYANDLDYDLLTVQSWRPPYDKGLAINKTVWHKITAASSYYCMYNDLSWSYSLLNVFSQFRGGSADMVAAMAPRVISTSMFPSGRVAIQKIHHWMAAARMFPMNVKAVMLYSSSGRVDTSVKLPPRGNGGWEDMRDHLLCLDPLMSTTSDNTNDLSTTTVPLTTVKSTEYLTIDQQWLNMSDEDIRRIL